MGTKGPRKERADRTAQSWVEARQSWARSVETGNSRNAFNNNCAVGVQGRKTPEGRWIIVQGQEG